VGFAVLVLGLNLAMFNTLLFFFGFYKKTWEKIELGVFWTALASYWYEVSQILTTQAF
jgi:hypothetical protein